MGDDIYEESEVNAHGLLQRKDVEEVEEVEEVETTPESDAVARKMLADAPARAAEKRRVEVKEAQKVVQRRLSIEERVAQLESHAGLSPIVEG